MDKSCLDGIGMLLLKEGKFAVNSIYSSIVTPLLNLTKQIKPQLNYVTA